MIASLTRWALESLGPGWGTVVVLGAIVVLALGITYTVRTVVWRSKLKAEIAEWRNALRLAERRDRGATQSLLARHGYAAAFEVATTRPLAEFREEIIEGLSGAESVEEIRATCASVSAHLPMVGLLGTLHGMSRCFALLGAGDPSTFAQPAATAVGTSIAAVGGAVALRAAMGLVHAQDLERTREGLLLEMRERLRALAPSSEQDQPETTDGEGGSEKPASRAGGAARPECERAILLPQRCGAASPARGRHPEAGRARAQTIEACASEENRGRPLRSAASIIGVFLLTGLCVALFRILAS